MNRILVQRLSGVAIAIDRKNTSLMNICIPDARSRHNSHSMYLVEHSPKTILGSNKQVYNQLKLALKLGLRRQIFVAVCDDLRLMYRIAARLELDLASRPSQDARQFGSSPSLGLVTLQLNLKDPSPIEQINRWWKKHPRPNITRTIDPSASALPNFQFLGVDLLTRKSSASQWYFLNELQELSQSLPSLEFSLVLWLTRPWCRTIAQSAPEFWSCRTGVFEFAGEPSPTTGLDDSPANTHQQTRQQTHQHTHQQHRVIPITSEFQQSGNLEKRHPQESAPEKSTPEKSAPEKSAPEKVKLPDNNSITGQIFHHDSAQIKADDRPEENTEPKTDRPQVPIGSMAATKTTGQPKLELVAMSDRSDLPETNPSTHLSSNPSTANNVSLSDADAKLYQLIGSTFLSPPSNQSSNSRSQPLVSESSVVEILQDIERLHQQEPQGIAELANAYLALGNLYRVALGRGASNPTYIQIAIAAYEQVVKWRDLLPNNPNSLGHEISNDIGNFYWMLCRFQADAPEQISCLEQAIASYNQSLTKLNPQQQPDAWAMVQNNLGSVYNEFARHRDRVKYLHRSIAAYQEVLRYRPDFETIQNSDSNESEKVAIIQAMATTQNNLATAYWNLAQHEESLKNLKRSLSAYTQALIALESQIHIHQSPQSFLNYAMIQNNLGTGYWNLAQYENAEDNLQLAIGAYQIALMYRTQDAAPVACAATHNNLGTAYLHLSKRTAKKSPMRCDYLRQAIGAYSTALEIIEQLQQSANHQTANGATATPHSITFDVFATYNNLGNAYYELAIETDANESGLEQLQADLNQALQHHLKASIGWQQNGQHDLTKNALSHLVQTIRGFYKILGVQGQNLALSQIPGELLPEVMPRLSALGTRG